MRTPLRIILIVIVGMLGLVLWLSLRSREPHYKGKSLSYWIDPAAKGGHETDQDRTDALTAMSTRAVPYLTDQLAWKPSQLMLRLSHLPFLPMLRGYPQGATDPRGDAAHQLGELGPLASNAIPALNLLTNTFDLGSSWHPRMCARAALMKIRQEPLAPNIEQLKDTSPLRLDIWYQNAMMIGEFGTNAAAAIPNLILALGPTNHEVIQAHALIALGEIRSQPETCLPVIIPFLKSPDIALRQKAVYALDRFGSAAKPASKELSQCLDDPDPWTRMYATKVLKKIDPEAAARAGVK